MFGRDFEPFENYNWKILLVREGIVTQHIIKEMSKAIYKMQNSVDISDAIGGKRWFSEIDTIRIRDKYSIEVSKTIFNKISYPSNSGGLEKAFIEFLDIDADVLSFIKINETQHRFASIYYIRFDGLLANYSPDFLVQTQEKFYIIETKGQDRIDSRNVKQKQLATLEWCKKINSLDPELREMKEWVYILLKETDFYQWSKNNATLTDICQFALVSYSAVQGKLFE